MKLMFIDINGKQELVDYIRLKEEAGKAAVFRFYALEMLGNKLNIGPTPDLMPLLNQDSRKEIVLLALIFANYCVENFNIG